MRPLIVCAALAAAFTGPAIGDEPKLAGLIELNRIKTKLEREFDLSQAQSATIKDPLARRQYWADFATKHAPVYQQALKIAEQNINDKTSVDALIWILVGPLNYNADTGPTIDRAITLLIEHHIQDQRLAVLCQAISRFEIQSANVEAILRAALEKAKPRNTRGAAAVRLGDTLAEQARVAELLRAPAASAEKEQWNAVLTPERRRFFSEIDVANNRKQAETAWEKAAADYSDVKLMGDVTVGDTARGRLFKRKDLLPGRPLPELTGHTLDGKPLNLRDYQGKVVVITFWAAWCPPSLALATKQREMLNRLSGKPFAALGVSCDYDLDSAQNAVDQSKIPWTSIFDGNAGRGKIAIKWGISSFPTILVVDAKGTIRHVLEVDDNLEQLVDQLLAEVK